MGLSELLGGFAEVLQPEVLLLAFLGCLAGTMVGVMPGLGPVSAIAILFPLTVYLGPAAAIVVLAAIYYGAMYGGSTSAILLKIPGEVSSLPAAIEGYPMTQRGRAGTALAIAAGASFVAGIAGTVGVWLIGPHIAGFALEFGPPEMLGLVLFSLTAIAGLSSGSIVRGVGMAVTGMLVASVGLDLTSSQQRMTFGSIELMQGLDIVPVMIGLFGIAEVLRTLENGTPAAHRAKVGGFLPTRGEFRRSTGAAARGTVTGFLLGLIPGMLPSTTTFLSYAAERRRAERKGGPRFGTGAVEGISGPEAANNATAMSGFVPLFSLGIPTGPTMALIMAALMVYGVVPGPTMFTADSDITAAVIASFFVANVILLVLNLPLAGVWAKIARVPYGVLGPIIIVCCGIGAYTARNSAFDIVVCLVAGVAGWAMAKRGLPVAPFVMGFILGPMLELSLRQTVAISPMSALESPIFLGFAAAALISVGLAYRLHRKGVENVDANA
ncbi:tripartite tricarboxylate transporter permease [Nocardiopsis mangrovi]|uniref:Tripartite tricarboxylate transporter permease n=1 Tax=Nocardiopsis mangrovi TaxID=1179818 RepID=A0ABV9DVR1_9ACTN